MPQQKQVERSIFPVPNTGQIIIIQLKSTAWSVNGTFIISRLKIKLENINNIFGTFRNRTAFLFRITSHFLPVDVFWFSTLPMFCFSFAATKLLLTLGHDHCQLPGNHEDNQQQINNHNCAMGINAAVILDFGSRGCWASETPRVFGARGKGIVIWQSSHLEDPLDNGIFADPYIFDVWIKWIGKYTVPCMDPVSCILTLEPWMKWTRMRCITILRRETSKVLWYCGKAKLHFTWHDDKIAILTAGYVKTQTPFCWIDDPTPNKKSVLPNWVVWILQWNLQKLAIELASEKSYSLELGTPKSTQWFPTNWWVL